MADPSVSLYPIGGEAGIIGNDETLKELGEMGWIGEKNARSGCRSVNRMRSHREGLEK